MADHLDAPGLMSPNMDARIDVTDIYAFQAPDDPTRAVLILNVNPLAPSLATAFSPAAIYELKIDPTATRSPTSLTASASRIRRSVALLLRRNGFDRLARIPIRHQVGAFHGSIRLEEGADRRFGRAKVQVTYKNLFQVNLLVFESGLFEAGRNLGPGVARRSNAS